MEKENALVQWESNESLQQRIKKMLEIQQNVMKKDIDYGVIPGCNKPSLFKPGSELLMVTFKVSDKPVIDDLCEDGIVRYRVRNDMYSIVTGEYLGYGIGECSSEEDKYKWRKSVCDEEWEETEIDRRREKWFKPYNKSAYQVKQVRTSPADVGNTVLKMAKKRSKIDGVLSVLAASRIYTQDIEDMSKEYQQMVADEGRPQSTKPVITQPTTEKKKTGNEISEGQVKRIYAMAKAANVDIKKLKIWVKQFKIESFAEIQKGKDYENICKTIEKTPANINNYKAPEPEKEEEAPDQNDTRAVYAHEDFLKMLRTVAAAAGCKTDEEINKKLLVNFPNIGIMDNIDAESQGIVIDYFVALKDNPEQA